MLNLPAAVALSLTLTVSMTACGSDDSEETSTASSMSVTEHNDADVAFATGMIQHHAQALAMVDLTMGRELSPEVLTLAEDIRAAQAPEIETMTDWLTEWGEEVPETIRDHASAGRATAGTEGGDPAEMPGTMSSEDLAELEDASDAEFEDLWLEMMIEHHEGAVEMAETEEADGQYKPAIGLAQAIQGSQSAEIETMRSLLS